jgi:hypothetical protein
LLFFKQLYWKQQVIGQKGDPAMNKKLLTIVLLTALVLSGTSLAYAKGGEIKTANGEQEASSGNWLLPYIYNQARPQPPPAETIEPPPPAETVEPTRTPPPAEPTPSFGTKPPPGLEPPPTKPVEPDPIIEPPPVYYE